MRTRHIETSAERLAWLIVVATIPVGITGLLLEHTFRTVFAKPLAAAIFLTINGLILLAGERLRRRSDQASAGTAADTTSGPAAPRGSGRIVVDERRQLDTFAYREAGVIGLFQTFALLAGISRSGITMTGGLLRGLDHEDAARFSFLLATPVILAAGVLKLPSLAGSAGAHIHGQIIVGVLCAGISAYLAVRFLMRFFQTRTPHPIRHLQPRHGRRVYRRLRLTHSILPARQREHRPDDLARPQWPQPGGACGVVSHPPLRRRSRRCCRPKRSVP